MIHRFIHFHEICKVSVAFPNNNNNNNKKANETSLTAGLFVSLNFSHSVRYVCAKHGALGDGIFCDQTKYYFPRSCDKPHFQNVAPQERESAPSKGKR